MQQLKLRDDPESMKKNAANLVICSKPGLLRYQKQLV